MYTRVPTGNILKNTAALGNLAPQKVQQNFACYATAATQRATQQAGGQSISYPTQNLINGKWQNASSGKTMEVFDPATGKVIANVPDSDSNDIDQAVKAARKAFDEGPWANKMSPAQRGRIIHKIGDLIIENIDELSLLESLDNGKPQAVAKAGDCALAANMFHYMSGWATKLEGQQIPPTNFAPNSYMAYTVKEPKGVVGQIIPWNFPILMAAWKLAPALAGGNCSVLKPAEQTPLSALRLGELMLEAGLPEGVVNIVNGVGENTGAPLTLHPGVDKVAFTGSTSVGKLILKQCASDLKRVTLELGGKSPNIVLEDADIETAVKGAAHAIFFNHGQCCNAGSRLFVHRSIYEEVVQGVKAEAQKIKLGKGYEASTQMGPLVSTEQQDVVYGYIQSGLEQGARMVTGGKKTGSEGYFLEPTVFADVKNDMKIYQEEIFGPVVVAIPFDNWEDLVPEANNSPYGLAAGIWTKDYKKAHKLARKLKAGTVWINCYHVFDAALPFGGFKQSGWGREMGREVLDAYTETKTLVYGLD